METAIHKDHFIVDEKLGFILDKENATPLELNIYVAYLIGRIDIHTMKNIATYTVKDAALYFYSPMGMNLVVPDYYHEHTECFLVTTHHGISVVSPPDFSGYIGVKMTVENGVPCADSDFVDCLYKNSYINKAALGALINYYEKKKSDARKELQAIYG